MQRKVNKLMQNQLPLPNQKLYKSQYPQTNPSISHHSKSIKTHKKNIIYLSLSLFTR
jgi:hypothetical protein